MLVTQTLEKLRAMRLDGMVRALGEQHGRADISQLDFGSRLGSLVEGWREQLVLYWCVFLCFNPQIFFMKLMMIFARRMIPLEASYLLHRLCCAWLFCSLLFIPLLIDISAAMLCSGGMAK